MTRDCRKCGKYIPYYVRIGGKQHNLKGRKFCLDCSPFKGGNRNRYDPDVPVQSKKPYSEWTEEQRIRHIARVYKYGLIYKRKLIDFLGGACKICGYNKCLRAMSFHHRDPGKKKHGLTISEMKNMAWQDILKEGKKCDLLCIRCHMEIEDKISAVNESNYRQLLIDGSSNLSAPSKN